MPKAEVLSEFPWEAAMTLNDESVGQIIQAFARAAINPAEWMPALSMMSDAMGSASSALELADLNTGFASINCTHQLDEDVIKLYEERVYQINPRVRRARRAPVGFMLDDRSLFIDDDPDMAEFLDWLRKTPNRFVQGAKLFQSGGQEIYFGSYFSEAQGPPESCHRDVHRLVVPHLVNFVAAGKALSANRLNNELVTVRHLETQRPFALLDRAGHLIECSSGFEAVLNATDVLTVRNKRLFAAHARHRQDVDRFLESALGAQRLLKPPLPIRLVTPSRPRGLILRAVPLQPGNEIFDVFNPAALVTLDDLDRPNFVKRGELIELFGLTPREADVSAMMSEGYSCRGVANQLTISEYTVRQHLKAVFGKVGVSRQSELVAIISRLS